MWACKNGSISATCMTSHLNEWGWQVIDIKHTKYVLEWIFNANLMVISVLWSEWPYMAILETYKCYIWFRAVFWREFNGDVHFVIRMTICGNSGKHISVIYGSEQFFDVNSMVMSVLWSEWSYMAIPGNMLYMVLSSFLTWIQWWCPFCDQNDHIWQFRETYKCYIWFWAVFWREFSGEVCFVIGVTIYGNTRNM